MIRMAVLDDSLPTQMDEAGAQLDDVEIAFKGERPDAFLSACRETRPHVIVVNVDLFESEPDPARVIAKLKEETGAELVIALYSFLRRRDLEALAEHGRPMRGPVSLARLRTQMLSVIVKHVLGGPSGARPEKPPAVEPGPARFSKPQLARLMEISSVVDCECPNHLAEIVASLGAFEAYAKNCENKSPKDAEVHADLALFTAQARAIMESALQRIVEHERIVI
ncbi:MAG TPA: hypothetical protein RMH85_14995 [Polyangiaceae bacterium LLY-WYZ-15_(1-7)]|nr:hypothetical protein [Polyangiaceae bacterium LLY-WYZ-15_(1-7)]HJL05945.1 hypothetical protein [Polyangiaceae bacterium LLY-WYZ-15_(1-7)]HJL09804.1 hypothetical protein [Polyangiaceae bacterium LLY-WYZ-15_(1-7)]HJL25502.1 hypothetical protein [Polyangiaceae bacterium LLY-WYZ-15_(1-7)]HJL28648.1 hypothetical protein [Polyangiaceae bacterium LLY-WYZ-15_(1-7)]